METLTRLFSSLWISSSRRPAGQPKRGAASSRATAQINGLEAFAEKIANAKNVIVMCGAGISVSAGIPDFRTPGTGLYSQLEDYDLPFQMFHFGAHFEPGAAEAVFDIRYFMDKPEAFRRLACELWPGRKYSPTPGHYFIRLLNDKGKLLRCFTQNIDSLETMAGLPKEKLVAAHGNFDTASCVVTGEAVPVDEVLQAYLNNTHDELNQKYGTKLVKPDIVFFGEELPKRYFEYVKKDFPKCDLLIVMGTSLQVHPFASLIEKVASGTPRLLINRERVGEYPYGGFDFSSSGSADIFFHGDCDVGCQQLAKLLKWESDLERLVGDGKARLNQRDASGARL